MYEDSAIAEFYEEILLICMISNLEPFAPFVCKWLLVYIGVFIIQTRTDRLDVLPSNMSRLSKVSFPKLGGGGVVPAATNTTYRKKANLQHPVRVYNYLHLDLDFTTFRPSAIFFKWLLFTITTMWVSCGTATQIMLTAQQNITKVDCDPLMLYALGRKILFSFASLNQLYDIIIIII